MLDEVSNGGMATWNEEEDRWIIPHIELSGSKNVRGMNINDYGSCCSLSSAGVDLNIAGRQTHEDDFIIRHEVYIPERSTRFLVKDNNIPIS